MAIGLAVMCYAWAAHTLSAEIEYRHRNLKLGVCDRDPMFSKKKDLVPNPFVWPFT